VAGMSKKDIMTLVNRYIGVDGGYLRGFSYSSHAAFYTEYCDLDFDPSTMHGTTRERFISILGAANPAQQAEIIRGILAKFPLETSDLETRNAELHDYFVGVASRLDGAGPVGSPKLVITSEVVERAISDAEMLITSEGATSGVDRLHTVLHGYLKAVCDQSGIPYEADATMNRLFRPIREQHPAFVDLGPRAQDITMVMRSMASIMDAMNPIRNNASVAHPNKDLLDAPEAMLVINAARTLLHYLDAKLAASPKVA
jgi:Abortive infection C-terminus